MGARSKSLEHFPAPLVLMDKSEDAARVAATLSGDLSAFEALVEKYERPIFAAAYRVVGDFETARDVAQTAFVKAFERLEDYNPRYKFFSWLYRIAINESINLVKRQSSFREEPVTPSTAVAGESPEQEVARREVRDRIQDALNRMDPKYRVMIVLKHVAECSYREIGQVLDLPEKIVKSRLFRARRMMKDMLLKGGKHG